MTESTDQTIAFAMLDIAERLEAGTLQRRLCADCGAVRHPGIPCAPVEEKRV